MVVKSRKKPQRESSMFSMGFSMARRTSVKSRHIHWCMMLMRKMKEKTTRVGGLVYSNWTGRASSMCWVHLPVAPSSTSLLY